MSVEGVEIRRLVAGDLSLFRNLNAMFGREFDDPESYGSRPPDDAWLERLLTLDHVYPLVAIADGEVVGGLVAYALDKFEQARREMYIYDLAIDARHRRRGIATILIEHLRELAARDQAYVIFVQADYGDDPAIALYDKLGTREEVLHFDIAVN